MQCPGQDNRYWSGEAVFEIPCPHCGNMLEFFKDDSQRTCKQCGHKVLNPKIDFGCASYCPYAEQCMGSLPVGLRSGLADLLRDKLTETLRQRLDGQTFCLIAARAESGEYLCREEGGNMAAVVAAALLSESRQPEDLLSELGAEKKLTEEVTTLLQHAPGTTKKESKSADLFHDACLLGDMRLGKPTPQASWRTQTGIREAAKIAQSPHEIRPA